MGANNFKVHLAQDLTLTESDGQTVLFSKKTGDFFGLNESAGLFLKDLTETDFESTLKKAAVTFSAPMEVLSTDLLELVDELEKQKLITRTAVS